MTNILAPIVALSLALQGPTASTPCPPKTTACANDTCSPIGVPCPSASEISVAAGQPVVGTAPIIVEPVWEASAASAAHDREWAYKSEKLNYRSRRDDCSESIDNFERRKVIRRVGFAIPGFMALSSSVGFAIGARILKTGGEQLGRIPDEYGRTSYEAELAPTRRAYIVSSVLFGLLGFGLLVGGLVSAERMERAGGACSAKGCSFTLRF